MFGLNRDGSLIHEALDLSYSDNDVQMCTHVNGLTGDSVVKDRLETIVSSGALLEPDELTVNGFINH